MQLKIVYHCPSCNKDSRYIETAKEHSKSLSHDVIEEFRRACKEVKSLDIGGSADFSCSHLEQYLTSDSEKKEISLL